MTAKYRSLKIYSLIALSVGIASCSNETKSASNSSDPLDQKVEALLSQMSVEEKAGQMTQVTIDLILDDTSFTSVNIEKLKTAIHDKHVGSILNTKGHDYSPETWRTIITKIQDEAKTTQHNIPVLYGIDAIHGATYISGSPLAPHNIGLAASRDTNLTRLLAHQTAKAVRAVGIPWDFDPVLGLGRQPLWSRFEETFGEDVVIVTEMGSATIKGYEQDGLSSPTAVASCMKHYLGYSLPASGKDRTPAYIPDQIMYEYLIPPFREAVKSGTSTVMINSGEVNGIPVHANKEILTTLLRDELGFEGLAVSDWEDVIRLHTRHHIADSPKEAVRIAVEAGLDMSMVPMDYSFYDYLVELIKEGSISEDRINQSVRRILKLKFRLGLFENAYPLPNEALDTLSAYTNQLTLDAARKTMTLLKNENNQLPISKDAKILVAGPGANSLPTLFSCWSYTWQGTDVSRYPAGTKTIAQYFTDVMGADKIVTSSTAEYSDDINYDLAQLKKDAAKVDHIVLCLGEKAYAESPGVIDDLNLDARQIALAEAAIATGKPVTVVLTEGRPRIISSFEPRVGAILQAYRPSTHGAQAIVETLLGDNNPSGVLPYTYPAHAGDIVLYDHKGTETIREDVPNQYGGGGFRPMYAFGHGLSYTTFEFSQITTSAQSFAAREKMDVTITVTNTGAVAGDKIVELYSKDHFASITPSVKRLRHFQRVSLEPGESTMVKFTLTPEDLAFANKEGHFITEPGAFTLMIDQMMTEITFK